LITALGMAGFVVMVYAIVVSGGGALVGRVWSPSVWLSVVATAIVAVLFEPVRAGLGGLVARLLHRDRTAPYRVLARFPSTVTGSISAEQVTDRQGQAA